MNETLVRKLLKALEAQAALYAHLRTACESKRDALVAYDPARVETVTAEEEALLARIGECDGLRSRLLAALLPGQSHPTVGLVMDRVEDAALKAELAGLREHLRKLALEVARLNRLNSQLCGQALAHMKGYLRVLSGVVSGDGAAVYNKNGQAKEAAARPLVDRCA